MRIFLLLCLICLAQTAWAQSTTILPQYQTAPGVNTSVSTSTPLPVGVYGGSGATSGYVYTSNGPGVVATFQPAAGGSGVTTWSGGTTGLTPASATSGPVTLGGVLSVANGGTGNGSFTQGSAIFAGSGGILTQDNTKFFWDDVNDRLGIGSGTPASSLDVVGTIHMTGNVSGQNTVSSFTAGNGGVIGFNAGESLIGPTIGTLVLGGTDSATPMAQTLAVQNVAAGTSNTAGALETIQGSKGTGTGVGGDVRILTSPAGSTGTTQNAGVERFRVTGGGVIQLEGGTSYKITAVADAAYTILTTDYEIAYTSITAARIVSISCTGLGTSAQPLYFIVKDQSGAAGVTNTITITPSAGTIDGAATKVISAAYGEIRIYANGTTCFQW